MPGNQDRVSNSEAWRRTLFEQASYWLTFAGVYFLVGVLFLYSGKGKLFDDDGHAPPALAKQFDGTFIGTFPGIDTALLTFACLSFGQTTTGNTAGTASLYTYFGATAIIYLLVARLQPRRP